MTEQEYFIISLIKNNMLQLFDINGNDMEFDFQRHICYSISDISLKIGNKNERIKFSTYAAVCLAKIWKINIEKSLYKKNFILLIQVENDWMQGKRGSAPPYVILNTFAKDKIYYYDVFSRMLDKEFIDKYNLSEILCGINYELFKSSNGDVRIVLVYKGD